MHGSSYKKNISGIFLKRLFGMLYKPLLLSALKIFGIHISCICLEMVYLTALLRAT
jgi:hypothetical protein